jgi:calcium-dependent protein kinase
VNFLATKEEKTELLKTFQTLDLNGDGKLSREELIIGNGSFANILVQVIRK